MDEQTAIQQSTSILELLYLIKAKNRGELTFADFMAAASSWAEAVIAEHEAGQPDALEKCYTGDNELSSIQS